MRSARSICVFAKFNLAHSHRHARCTPTHTRIERVASFTHSSFKHSALDTHPTCVDRIARFAESVFARMRIIRRDTLLAKARFEVKITRA